MVYGTLTKLALPYFVVAVIMHLRYVKFYTCNYNKIGHLLLASWMYV